MTYSVTTIGDKPTRVRWSRKGMVGDVIEPLPLPGPNYPGNVIVKFDDEDCPSRVPRHELEVVEFLR